MISPEKAQQFKRAFGKTVAIQQRPEALFRSVRSALAFAYSIQHFPISASPSLLPTVGNSGRLSNFSPQEKHAQGALIRKAAEQRLRGMDLAITWAYYGTGEVRATAIHEVSKEVAKLVRRSGLGMELAKRHFSRNGIRKSQEQLAKEFNVSQQTASRLDILVANEIDRLRMVAEQRLEQLFVSTGIAETV